MEKPVRDLVPGDVVLTEDRERLIISEITRAGLIAGPRYVMLWYANTPKHSRIHRNEIVTVE